MTSNETRASTAITHWIIVLSDGTLDGGIRLHDAKGRERSMEDALKVLCPRKADLLAWATSGATLRHGTADEILRVGSDTP